LKIIDDGNLRLVGLLFLELNCWDQRLNLCRESERGRDRFARLMDWGTLVMRVGSNCLYLRAD